MPRYVALLRGINVGGQRKVPMARLRALLGALGCAEVQTVLQSGNAVFTATGSAADVRTRLEEALAAEFGFPIPVVLRTREELVQAIAACPFSEADDAPSRFVVLFADRKLPASAVAGIDPAAFAPDAFVVRGRELYASFPNGVGRSKLAALLLGPRFAPGLTVTSRNWATVQKLRAAADGA